MKIKIHNMSTNTFLQVSFLKNLLSGMFRLLLGIFTNGMFLMLMSVYNFLLCFTKAGALNETSFLGSKLSIFKYDKIIQFFMYLFMLILALLLDVISIRMYHNKSIPDYNIYTVLLLATGSFTKLGLSIYGLFTKAKYKKQLVYTIKLTNFADALFSIVLTQSAILYLQHARNAELMNTILGISVGFILILLSVKGMIEVYRMDNFKTQWKSWCAK